MNKAYKLVWSECNNAWVAVAEFAKSHVKRSGGAVLAATLLAIANPVLALDSNALPTGPTVAAGAASVTTSGNTMTVEQASSKAIINWNQFNVGADATVNFAQPNTDSVTLNRVISNEISQIYGAVNANGNVWLLNQAGILIGNGARINVGGFLGSTLDIADEDFLSGNYKFINYNNNQVVNSGSILAAGNGGIVLLGGSVLNDGTLRADKGNIALASGGQVLINAGAEGRLSLAVDGGAFNAIVENKGAIVADGGEVLLSAQAQGELVSSVVNNEGEIRARTLESREGKILLLASMENGSVHAGGALDASAPTEGDGGFIETSAKTVSLGGDLTVTTLSENGKTGTWLIDPTDVEINTVSTNPSASFIDVNVLQANLDTTNQVVQTVGAGVGAGDIYVMSAIEWTGNTTLTLNAHNGISLYAPIVAHGASAGLVMSFTTDYYLSPSAPIALLGSSATFSINGDAYTVVNDLTKFQAIAGDLSGRYVLGADLDLSSLTGYVPIGDSTSMFTGQFHALGHTLSNLSVSTADAGLFGSVGFNGVIRDLQVSGAYVDGASNAGIVAAYNEGVIYNTRVTNSTVTGAGSTGGMVGENAGLVTMVEFDGAVIGNGQSAGGIVGSNLASGGVTSASVSGSVTGSNDTGGVAGNNAGVIGNTQTYAGVSGVTDTGGVTGQNTGTLSEVLVSGGVTGLDNTGGIAGNNASESVYSTYAMGAVSGANSTGGLFGFNSANFSNLIAENIVTGSGANTGGLIGYNTGNLDSIIGQGYVYAGSDNTGGVIGLNEGVVSNISSNAIVGNASYTYNNVGGVIGSNTIGQLSGVVSNASLILGGGDSWNIGGVVGYNSGATSGLVSNSQISITSDLGMTVHNIGGIAGTTEGVDGDFSNASALGSINISADNVENAGGIAGSAKNITFSQAQVDIQINNSTSLTNLGGLVGQVSQGALQNNQSSSTVAINDVANASNIGGLAGYQDLSGIADSIADGTISIVNTGVLASFTSNVGGLVGNTISSNGLDGQITNSSSSATITLTNLNGLQSLGGLVGMVSQTSSGLGVVDVSATGAIIILGARSLHEFIGGLIGINGDANNGVYGAGISNANYTGTIVLTAGDLVESVGGLVGRNSNANINNSTVNAMIASEGVRWGMGGLVGWNQAYETGLGYITGSTSYGDIVINGADVRSRSVGGVVGYNQGYTGDASGNLVNIDSEMDVSITASNHSVEYIGGLIGYNDAFGLTFDNLNSRNNISIAGEGISIYYVGGIAGSFESAITNSVSSSNVNVSVEHPTNDSYVNYVGSAFGDIYEASSNVQSTGALTISGGYIGSVGGMIGANYALLTDFSSHSDLVISTTTGNVYYAGGLAGYSGEDILRGSATGDISIAPRETGNGAAIEGNNLFSRSLGGLVGWNIGANIFDSSFSGSLNVTNGKYIGGIAGSSQATASSSALVQNSVSLGAITINQSDLVGYIGGVVGFNIDAWDSGSGFGVRTARVVNSTGNSAITVNSNIDRSIKYVGGLVGYNSNGLISGSTVGASADITINQAFVTGSSTESIASIGAVIGDNHAIGGQNSLGTVELPAAHLTNITASNDVSISTAGIEVNSVGGIVGSVSSYTLNVPYTFDVQINNANYSGTITVNDSATTSGVYGVGGIVGFVGTPGDVLNSGFTGAINITSGGEIAEVGGVGGYTSTLNMSGITASGAVSVSGDSVNNIGGLVGELHTGVINSSSYAGSIVVQGNAVSYVGGLVGAAYGTLTQGDIVNSSSSGNLTLTSLEAGTSFTATVSYVGGLVGYTDTMTLSGNSSSSQIEIDVNNRRIMNIGGLVGSGDITNFVTANTFTGSLDLDSGDVGNGSVIQVGGIAGQLRSGSAIQDVTNNSTITINAGYADTIGGILGIDRDWDTTITDASSAGAINITAEAARYIGGVMGLGSSISNSGASNNISVELDYTSSGVFAVSIGGLAGYVDTLTNVSASGDLTVNTNTMGGYAAEIGGLAGTVDSSIDGSTSSTNVTIITGDETGTSVIGGLVGAFNGTTLQNSSASGAVDVTANNGDLSSVGGLVGISQGSATISGSSATGSVTLYSNDDINAVGGLVGRNFSDITNSTVSNTVLATGWAVSGIGGLAGYSSGDITSSTSNTAITVASSHGGVDDYLFYIGGLVGETNGSATISSSTSAGAIVISGPAESLDAIGGLVGFAFGDSITNSTSSTSITAVGNTYYAEDFGGLVGENFSTITGSSSSGTITFATDGSLGLGDINMVGGLVGSNYAAITNSFTTSNISLQSISNIRNVGGLAGAIFTNGDVLNSNASGSIGITNPNYSYAIGGLVGYNNRSNISGSTATVSITGNSGAFTEVGGLVGWNVSSAATNGLITDSTANGALIDLDVTDNVIGNVGGLIGANEASAGVTNVTNSNSTVTIDATGHGYTTVQNLGGAIGDNLRATLNNVDYSGNILVTVEDDGSVSIGGLVGNNRLGSVTNGSSSAGTLQFTNNSLSDFHTMGTAGGLVGYQSAGTIANASSTMAQLLLLFPM